MLTVYKPQDGEENPRRRKLDALLYLIAGGIIIAATFVAYSTSVWPLPLAVEAWWMRAVLSQDWKVK